MTEPLKPGQEPAPAPNRPMGKVDTSFYLIGVGASAGGLDALKQLISQVPQDFPHSLVVIQHISPDYKSLMSDILGRETSLAVREVTDDMPVEPGHIYLIPPRSNLVIQGTAEDSSAQLTSDGVLQNGGLRFSLVEPTPRPLLNLPIDVFLHSLSEAVGDRAISIILSGSGSDGSRGLRTVKDREGFVLVQEPGTAAFDGMPKSAIATGIVDVVLSPDAMIGEIRRYIEMRESGIDNVDHVFHDAHREFMDILKMASQKADIDFSLYKAPTLKRRIARRMGLRGLETLTDYLELLKQDTSELNVLHREFLVGVTNFFRDRPVWEALDDLALPSLFNEELPTTTVRVWSVGCSTGEEAYSLAMLMQRYIDDKRLPHDFRVYATDVNEAAIQAAKQGLYPDSVREEIPDDMIDRGYISFQSGTFKISGMLRNKVFFSAHNAIDDAPFTSIDLLVCRNLLIYLGPDVQTKLMARFAFSLRKHGFLMLGAAEGPSQLSGYFEAVAHKPRLYRNMRPGGGEGRRADLSAEFPISDRLLPRNRNMTARPNTPLGELTLLMQDMLGADGSCICIVDEQYKVIKTWGAYKSYIHMPEDAFSANIFELVDHRLRSAVTLVLRRADTEGQASKKGVLLNIGDEVVQLDLKCQKRPWEAHSVAYALFFKKRAEPSVTEMSPEKPLPGGEASATYVKHLESEIQSLQDMLSDTAEDLGASNEELQTTNEELIASNEELQANNEETQSINEELHTLNAENADKIAELEAATADISNLLATVDLGVLVLDDTLSIRQFSQGMLNYVELEAGDIGRPIANFALGLEPEAAAQWNNDCRLARDVGEERTREVRTAQGGWALSRVRTYRNAQGERRGVVASLQDITAVKILETEVRDQRDRLEGLLESETAGYWDWNIPEKTEYMSPRFKAMLGYAEHEIEDTREAWQSMMHEDDLPRVLENFETHVASRGAVPYDNEVRYWHRDGALIWVLCRGRVVEWAADGAPIRMMGVHVDITELKAREAEIQTRANELRRFAFIAAHDLVQPVNTIENALSILTEDMPTSGDPDKEMSMAYLQGATARLRDRVNGILDYARLKDEQTELHPVNLQELATHALADLESQIQDAGAEVTVEALPVALGSQSLLSQVMQNLVSNAIKYRAPDRPSRIAIAQRPAADGMVAFAVTDNGIGIDAKHREKVFELFTRLHSDDEIEGNGIGLALCERIVDQHGGSMTIDDGVDGGTAFIVALKEG